jgi:hypothetical protein
VTTAQRARLVLALGVMNLVLAVAAVAVGGLGNPAPGFAPGASGVAIAPTAPAPSAAGSGGVGPGASPGSLAPASPPQSLPTASPPTGVPSPSATPTNPPPGSSATPEPGTVGPPAVGQTPAPTAAPTAATGGPAPKPTARPTPRPTSRPTPPPTAAPAISRPRPPCPGAGDAPPGHAKVFNPSRPCGQRVPRRHRPQAAGTAGSSAGWAWLIVFALPAVGGGPVGRALFPTAARTRTRGAGREGARLRRRPGDDPRADSRGGRGADRA